MHWNIQEHSNLGRVSQRTLPTQRWWVEWKASSSRKLLHVSWPQKRLKDEVMSLPAGKERLPPEAHMAWQRLLGHRFVPNGTNVSGPPMLSFARSVDIIVKWPFCEAEFQMPAPAARLFAALWFCNQVGHCTHCLWVVKKYDKMGAVPEEGPPCARPTNKKCPNKSKRHERWILRSVYRVQILSLVGLRLTETGNSLPLIGYSRAGCLYKQLS